MNPSIHQQMKRLLSVASALAVFSMAACTSLLTPLGSEKYDCNRKENPASPYCHSFRSVAEGTNAPIPDSRYDTAVRISDVDRLAGIAPPAATTGDSADAPARREPGDQGGSALPPANRPARANGNAEPSDATPVRLAPVVQRTWVKRHVENGDRLVGSTYVYKEVTRGRWAGFVESSDNSGSSRGAVKPHLPPEDDPVQLRSAASAVNKGATALVNRVKSGLSQPGLATPAGEVVVPPIDGTSMPQ